MPHETKAAVVRDPPEETIQVGHPAVAVVGRWSAVASGAKDHRRPEQSPSSLSFTLLLKKAQGFSALAS